MTLTTLIGGWPPRDWRPLCHVLATVFGACLTVPFFYIYTVWIEQGPEEALDRLRGEVVGNGVWHFVPE